MRAMIASGIDPSAIAGRIRCLIASQAAYQLPVAIPSDLDAIWYGSHPWTRIG